MENRRNRRQDSLGCCHQGTQEARVLSVPPASVLLHQTLDPTLFPGDCKCKYLHTLHTRVLPTPQPHDDYEDDKSTVNGLWNPKSALTLYDSHETAATELGVYFQPTRGVANGIKATSPISASMKIHPLSIEDHKMHIPVS